MPDLDHTKSLKPFKAILEFHEQDYRDSGGDERSEVIDRIFEAITEQADNLGATIAGGEDLRKVRGVLAL
jgi:hypothetical protein